MSINFRKTSFLKVAAKLEDCPMLDLPEIVLAGRSNVGNRNLAKVSSTPGKTRLVVYFLTDNSIIFADLPGYGYAKTSKEIKHKFQGLVDDYFNSGRNFSLVIHLIDIRHKPSEEDKLMKWWMDENNINYIVVLTKSDKLSKLQIKKRVDEIRTEMQFSEDITITPFSAIQKTGINEIKGILNEKIRNNFTN